MFLCITQHISESKVQDMFLCTTQHISDSAIGQHLLDNKQCATNYNDKRFKILAVARNSFHLCLFEATFIKTRHPVYVNKKNLFTH